MESKELKDLRRGMVTRTARITRVSYEYLDTKGHHNGSMLIRGEYSSDEIKREVVRVMYSKNALVVDFKVTSSVYGLYGMEEDEFFENAKLLKEIKK